MLILYSTDLDGGTSRGMQQAMYYGVGIVVMLGCIMLVRYVRRWSFLIYVVMGGAVLLLALPLAIGTEQYGATNWIRVGGMSLQPSEVVKLALLLILSYFMSHRRLIPWLAFCLYCLGVLMLQKDLGTALIYYFTALFMVLRLYRQSADDRRGTGRRGGSFGAGLSDVRPREKARGDLAEPVDVL